MEISDRIKKFIFQFWKKHGIDTSDNFFTQFGIDMRELHWTYKDEGIQELVIEYYGGVEKTLDKLNRLKDKDIEDDHEYGGIRFKITRFIYDKGEKIFFYDVVVDGSVEILNGYDEESTIYDEWKDEGLSRDFTEATREYVEDVFYDKITTKTKLTFILEDLIITKPGEYNGK